MSVYVHMPGMPAGSGSPIGGATDWYFGLRTEAASFTGGEVMPPSPGVPLVPPPPWVAPSPASPPVGELEPAPPFMPPLLPLLPVLPPGLAWPPVPVVPLTAPFPPLPLLVLLPVPSPEVVLESSSPFDEQPRAKHIAATTRKNTRAFDRFIIA